MEDSEDGSTPVEEKTSPLLESISRPDEEVKEEELLSLPLALLLLVNELKSKVDEESNELPMPPVLLLASVSGSPELEIGDSTPVEESDDWPKVV